VTDTILLLQVAGDASEETKSVQWQIVGDNLGLLVSELEWVGNSLYLRAPFSEPALSAALLGCAILPAAARRTKK